MDDAIVRLLLNEDFQKVMPHFLSIIESEALAEIRAGRGDDLEHNLTIRAVEKLNTIIRVNATQIGATYRG